MLPSSPPRAVACLGDDTVAALLEGVLSGDDAKRARDHVGSCDACRRLVARVVEHGATFASAHGSERETLSRTAGEALLPGAVVAGKFRVDGIVGRGGMGVVFAARQLDLDRPVALKVLRPELARDAVALARFEREARLASGLMSDHTVRIYELGRLASGEPYVVMELLIGEDLGPIVARGPVDPARALAWMLAACEAIGEAHALGIVHRDIKPGNLFVARDARTGRERLKVLDFGLAKLTSPVASNGVTSMTDAGTALGSPRYMPPEQLGSTRDVDARADVWALGATLYHLLSGIPPFGGADIYELAVNIRTHRPQGLAIGAPVAAVVFRCLEKDPRGRFANAEQLRVALAHAWHGGGASPPPEWLSAPPHAPNGRGALRAMVHGANTGAVGTTGPVAVPFAPPAPARARAGAAAGIFLALGIGLLLLTAIASVIVVLLFVRAGARIAGALPAGLPARGTNAEGPLADVDESELRHRLENAGWKVGETTRQDFGTGCKWVDFEIERSGRGGTHVFLFECTSSALAANEASRIRRGIAGAFVVLDADRALVCGAGAEGASRAICDAVTKGKH